MLSPMVWSGLMVCPVTLWICEGSGMLSSLVSGWQSVNLTDSFFDCEVDWMLFSEGCGLSRLT